jgi:6-phosphogluconolactonase
VEIRHFGDRSDLAHSAAQLILEHCEHTLAGRSGDYTLGLSGGQTPQLMFDALAELPMPWTHVHIFQVDERVAAAGSDDRNFTQLTSRLLDRVEIPTTNVHPMPVESDDLPSACQSYEDELQRITGGAPLDLLQLGLGDDGHTASLPPGDPIIDMDDRAIWHVESFNGLTRMSMTYLPINRAKRIVWLAVGATKAEMCHRLVSADRTIPAGRVSQDNAVLLVDRAAAAAL